MSKVPVGTPGKSVPLKLPRRRKNTSFPNKETLFFSDPESRLRLGPDLVRAERNLLTGPRGHLFSGLESRL